MKKFLQLSLLCSFLFCGLCFSETKTQLNVINKHIHLIQADLQKATHKKQDLQSALKKTEIKNSRITQQLKKINQQLQQKQRRLQQLEKTEKPLLQQQIQQRKTLEQQIRTAYLLSQQPALKIILDPDQLKTTERALIYFHYLAQAQTETLKKLQYSIAAYTTNQTTIQQETQELETLKQTQLKQQNALLASQKERKTLIRTMNQNIHTKHQKLTALLNDKKRLEHTLLMLNRKKFENLLEKQSIKKLRGHLPWPTLGRIRHHFGTQIDQSELRWNGIVITAPTGHAVHAVATGQVIFAKWLSGYGLLMIINHGNGYMTLYGRNQTLLKKTGDWVKAGTPIATVGHTGGFTQSALYFSIRHNTTALNPENWFRRTA